MKKQLAAALAAFALLSGVADAEEAPESLDQFDELETVLVTGEATPRLWKLSKDDHVLWVAADAVLRPGRVWRSDQVDAHIAESQLVLYPGFALANPDIGVLKAITLLPAAFKAAKNPDGKTLKDVLPADIYAKWRALKTTYVGRDNDIEKWRPSIAFTMLESEVQQKISPVPPKARLLKPGPSVRSVVDRAAKKHKVKIRTMPTVKRVVQVKNARQILKSAHHIELGDTLCFAASLEYLERLIEFARQRAAAPQGAAPARPQRVSCDDATLKALRSGEIPDPYGALKVLDELELQNRLAREQLDEEWVAAAQAAIAKNKSTFAVVPGRATSPTGYLATLRELGYTVEGPD